MTLHRSLIAFALVVALGLGVAGCERVEQEQRARDWGQDACTALGHWASDVLDAAAAVERSPDLDTLRSAILDASTATRRLPDEVDEAGEFPGPEGDDVEAIINAFETRADRELDAIEADADALQTGGNPFGNAAAIAALRVRIEVVAADVVWTVDELDRLPVAANLDRAASNAPACRALRRY